MTTPALLGLATQLPAHRHLQMDLHDRWLFPFIHSQRARAIFAAAEIESRYSVMADSSFLDSKPTTQARNQLYLETARPLALAVIQQALANAKLTPRDLDHFIITSCTGWDTPGLEVTLAAELGMKPTLRRTALMGMGCQAGLTGLDRAMLEITARPQSLVLLVAVELCSLQFQHGNTLENMIADALFGDGLGAAILGHSETAPRLLDTMSYHHYAAPTAMGVHLSDHGYQIELATRVPKLLRQLIPEIMPAFFNQVGLKQNDIRFWGIHPGGAKIVEVVGESLHLSEMDLSYARRVLRHYGNMSSATIFFVLEDMMQHGNPQRGDYAILMTFGPGLTVELALMQF